VNKSCKIVLCIRIAENSQSRCMSFKTRLKGSTLLTHTMVGMVGILNTRDCVELAETLGIRNDMRAYIKISALIS